MSDSSEVVANNDFGSVLAKAREKQNCTVDEVNRQLKIPSHIIAAIEASNLEELPPSTFTQGYIRNYARFLEIDENAVLTIYNRAVPDNQASALHVRKSLNDDANSQTPLIRLVTVLLVVAVVVIVAVSVFQYYQEKAGDMESELQIKDSSFVGNSLDSLSVNGTKIEQNASLSADGELIVNKVKEIVSIEDDLSIKDSASESFNEDALKMSSKALVVAEDQDVLEISAKNGSWVEVHDSNNDRLFYGLLENGRDKKLIGDAPFSVLLGNAKSTKLIVNNLDVDMTDHILPNNTVKLIVSNKNKKVIIN